MNPEKNASMSPDPKTSSRKDPSLHYTSESYQKILDYHVSEILLTTIVFGIILLVRLHH